MRKSIILCLFAMFWCNMATGQTASIKGDVNNDGTVNETDVTIIKDRILNRSTAASYDCDVSGDGIVTVEDIALTIEELKKYNSHEYVDLGLSVKWATCNVGAEEPEDYGEYYAWGEIEPKSEYDYSTYKYCTWKQEDEDPLIYVSYTKYSISDSYGVLDDKTVLELEDDVAHVNWGGCWRMPSRIEFEELCDVNNCNWTRCTKNGVDGYSVVSKKNGNSIFLPAAGYRYESKLHSGICYYWTNTLSDGYSGNVYALWGSSVDTIGRMDGRTVRPVCP